MNIKLLLVSSLFVLAPVVSAEEFVFSQSMLQLSGINNSNALNDDSTFYKEGRYRMKIYINNRYHSQRSIPFEKIHGKLTPLFNKGFIDSLSLKNATCRADLGVPVELQRCQKQAEVTTDFSSMKIDILIPQELLVERPVDYIPNDQFQAGSTMLFSNYNINQFVSHTSGSKTLSSTYLGLDSGINVGKWQFRQQGSFNKFQGNTRWRSNRSYVQRALPEVNSQLLLGQLSSTGEAFGSVAYDGINLHTDTRMLPASVINYAPVVRGNARSNARVEVFQQKNKIYETTVPAGNFKITTLNPVVYGGDLRVVVTETDGSQTEYTLPFSQLPGSVRPGRFEYAASAGRLRDYSGDNQFIEFSGKYGVNNLVTASGGVRVGKQYRSAAAGAIYNNSFGAFGSKLTWSDASIRQQGRTTGWMMDANYSKTITPTNTTVSFAGYRYSTKGYRELQDVVALNSQQSVVSSFEGGTYMQKNRIQATISQSLAEYGNLYVSGSSQNYYDGRSKDTAYQMGYNVTLPYRISMDLSVARQYQVRATQGQNWQPDMGDNRHREYTKQTQFTINFSIPLGSSPYANTLTTSYYGGDDNNSYQTSLSGISGDNRDVLWGVNYNHTQQNAYNSVGANISTVLPKATVQATAQKSAESWQASGSVNGAIALHTGGATFGNTLGDTFGLVEAKGAEGARILNYQNVVIDKHGYALIPSLMPYRYNSISLDTPEANSSVDIIDSEQKVVPYAGAAIKVTFKTRTGVPVMMQITRPDGSYLPMGAEIRQESTGESLGIVGQAGNAYLRLDKQHPVLSADWPDNHCLIDYPTPELASGQSLVFSNAVCR